MVFSNLNKYIIFRVDASFEIGTGHFMRCLTLALDIKRKKPNYKLLFLYRNCFPLLLQILDVNGIEHTELNTFTKKYCDYKTDVNNIYSNWLGVSQKQDAEDTKSVLKEKNVVLLIVDHYALSLKWENELNLFTEKMLVIDDLANRSHNCDYLLDQNLYTNQNSRYIGKVNHSCKLMLGPRYALLRPEFKKIRAKTSTRSILESVLVAFGGVDLDSHTSMALQVLKKARLKKVDIIVSQNNPNIKKITSLANNYNYNIHIQTTEIHTLMAINDLAIGASGATSWERCCVGLPCVCFPVAQNQIEICRNLEAKRAVYAIHNYESKNLFEQVSSAIDFFRNDPNALSDMSENCYKIVDGKGVDRVLDSLESIL